MTVASSIPRWKDNYPTAKIESQLISNLKDYQKLKESWFYPYHWLFLNSVQQRIYSKTLFVADLSNVDTSY